MLHCEKTTTVKTKTIFWSQILQNAWINIVLHWKFWRKYGSVCHLLSCTKLFLYQKVFKVEEGCKFLIKKLAEILSVNHSMYSTTIFISLELIILWSDLSGIFLPNWLTQLWVLSLTETTKELLYSKLFNQGYFEAKKVDILWKFCLSADDTDNPLQKLLFIFCGNEIPERYLNPLPAAYVEFYHPCSPKIVVNSTMPIYFQFL